MSSWEHTLWTAPSCGSILLGEDALSAEGGVLRGLGCREELSHRCLHQGTWGAQNPGSEVLSWCIAKPDATESSQQGAAAALSSSVLLMEPGAHPCR